ncbi:MAG TPA: hypothetical protein PKC39_07485 [Ferruginibacter sp.]|nr:hypothetical protein [Ferruginibacter sp.]HMP20785.1 hypothetical protein [Ferruginibacter sp.]
MKLRVENVVAFLLIISSCKKTPVKDPCLGLQPPVAAFAFKEVLNDTSFYADTIFSYNPVNFVALANYKSVLWKVGSDPREFTSPDFNLRFLNNISTYTVDFTAYNDPNTLCFSNDNGIYKASRQLTVVEPYDKSTLTLSPMIGNYRGAFTNTPEDSFTVRIEYFDSTKYDVTLTGNKNFYIISNIPKGYRDTTSEPARQYPELSYGQRLNALGYKSLEFGSYADVQQGIGAANLVKDSLKIYYFNLLTGRQLFVGKRI